MFEDKLIQFCSPTLAHIKTGSLFTYSGNFYDIELAIAYQNTVLNPKGVYIRCLSYKKNNALIYVYRPEMLKKDLSSVDVRYFLSENGYRFSDVGDAVTYLSQRVQKYSEFPHEIGLFLSYPLDDVKSFIANKGNNYICSGYWKVYHNADKAQKSFKLYRKCSDIYSRLFNNGKPLEQLVVV